MTSESSRDAIAIAERMFILLEQGKFTSTYKFSVMVGLMDLCLEQTSKGGLAPNLVTTRQLAEKVVELYWPHTTGFALGTQLRVLKQGGADTQAEIVSAIIRYRDQSSGDNSAPLSVSRAEHPARYERLVRTVEWKLIEMPLPRLQEVGPHSDEFLYTIGWDKSVTQKEVTAYQRGDNPDFDNRILLKPGIGDCLVVLNSLLRPLLYRTWASKVARMNDLGESRLEDFLFGVERISLDAVRADLMQLQQYRCFYCSKPIQKAAPPEVDHFIPWSRYPDNGIYNLVIAHRACNGDKSHFLAASDHVLRWADRFGRAETSAQLQAIARARRWEVGADRTAGVCRSVYLRLPANARLWRLRKDFVPPDPDRLRSALESLMER